jgi:DNA-binding transcriptional LysR family regulator
VKLNALDLNKLHVFVAAAQAGGFAPAAQKLGLSRSAVSQSVGALESSLGLALFDRVGRGTLLNERGRRLLDRVVAYQAELEAAISEVTQSENDMPRGTARIGLFIGFSKLLLSAVVAEFLARYPHAGVKLLFLPQADLAARLAERKLDAALSIYPLDRKARVLQSVRLRDEELVLISGRKHHQPSANLRQIRKLPFVDYYENGELARAWIRHHFRTDPGAIQVRAHVAAADFVLELVLKDVGVGIVPRSLAAPYLANGALKEMRTQRRALSDSIWLNQVRGIRHTPAAARLLEGLSAAFAG